MNKIESCFCDPVESIIRDTWNVALSDLHDKHHGLTNALNW